MDRRYKYQRSKHMNRDLTRVEYHQLAMGIISIRGVEREGLEVLLAGIAPNICAEIVGPTLSSAPAQVLLWLMRAVEYVSCHGWERNMGEPPLISILENARLLAQYDASLEALTRFLRAFCNSYQEMLEQSS